MLDAIVAFIIAALSGMGIGSGGFLVIYLTLAEGVAQITAQGINLLFFLFSSAASLFLHMRRRKLFGGAILAMSAMGVIGSPLGSLAAAVLPSDILRKLFGGMLIISGMLALRKSLLKEKRKKNKKYYHKKAKNSLQNKKSVL
ncbi:MAG: sulfite exporter TauE/SafE family protein [Clostridia bacterium]|nr:sulfite exporter TauE/SafE family protein [Clostridia bacterium]